MYISSLLYRPVGPASKEKLPGNTFRCHRGVFYTLGSVRKSTKFRVVDLDAVDADQRFEDTAEDGEYTGFFDDAVILLPNVHGGQNQRRVGEGACHSANACGNDLRQLRFCPYYFLRRYFPLWARLLTLSPFFSSFYFFFLAFGEA